MFTAGVPGDDREEDESGVGNGRVGEETLEVVLWDGGQVACQEGEAGGVGWPMLRTIFSPRRSSVPAW